eukprot:PLAT4394.1.p1 GENE.PLAT4394.1~~PLAT4394.1.p1  ORF type:complete len:844 (-),score=335.09 PLAT4394.1:94-2625(-)
MTAAFRSLLLLAVAAPLAAAQQLSITWFDWAPCQALRQLVRDFPGATVTVNCVDISVWQSTTFQDFENKAGADIVVLDSQWIGEAVDGGHIIELNDVADELDLGDYYTSALQYYGEYPPLSGRYWGIAFMGDVQMLVYNRELLRQAGHMRVPWSWSELLEMAEQFSTGNMSGRGIAGYTAPFCGRGCYDEAATTTNQILWSFGGALWDVDTYRVEGILDSASNVEALQFAKRLVDTGTGPAPNKAGYGDVVARLCNGTTAMGSIWMGFGPSFRDPDGCAASANLSYAVVPGESSHFLSLGGMGIHISKYSKNKAAAREFILWVESQSIQRRWARMGGFSPRKSVMASTNFLDDEVYNPIYAVSYPITRDFWNLKEYTQLLSLLMAGYDDVFAGQATAKQALTSMAKDMQRVLDKAYPTGPPHLPLQRLLTIPTAVYTFSDVLAALGNTLVLVCLVVNVSLRKLRYIRLSSPLVNNFILLGAAMSYSSVFITPASSTRSDADFAARCTAKLWLLNIGFSLGFGALFAKTYRVHRIFNNKNLRKVKMHDSTLLSYVGVLQLCTVFLLTLWSALSPQQKQLLVQQAADVLRSGRQVDNVVQQCSSADSNWQFVLYAYDGVLLLFGGWLTFQVRHVRVKSMNDSKLIGMCLYTLLLVSVVVVPTSFIVRSNLLGSYLLIELSVILSVTAVVLILFSPKLAFAVRYLRNKAESNASSTASAGTELRSATGRSTVARQRTTNRSSASSGHTGDDGDSSGTSSAELSKLHREIATLKRRSERLQDENDRLMTIVRSLRSPSKHKIEMVDIRKDDEDGDEDSDALDAGEDEEEEEEEAVTDDDVDVAVKDV